MSKERSRDEYNQSISKIKHAKCELYENLVDVENKYNLNLPETVNLLNQLLEERLEWLLRLK